MQFRFRYVYSKIKLPFYLLKVCMDLAILIKRISMSLKIHILHYKFCYFLSKLNKVNLFISPSIIRGYILRG